MASSSRALPNRLPENRMSPPQPFLCANQATVSIMRKRHQHAGQDAGQEQRADRDVGHHRVDHERQRRRDDGAERGQRGRHGYDLEFAVGVTAASATLGPIIPPSLPFVIYAMMANVSVGALFLAGILPGVLMAVLMMLTVAYFAHKNGWGGDIKFSGRASARR